MIIKNIKDLLSILTTIKFCDVDGIEKVKAIDLAIEIIKDWSHHSVKIIGNVISDKWFDYESFFSE